MNESKTLGSSYLLHETIGRGAMGTVWRGSRRLDGSQVAVKILNAQYMSDPETVARFLRERSILTSLDHPNIARLRDLVAEGDTIGFVMDLVEGGDLRDYLAAQGGSLPEWEAKELLSQILDGLQACHAAGVIHRDLKLTNILVDRSSGSPVARITDFGIARLAQSGQTMTAMGSLVGTFEYMAPEVAEGNRATAATDLYSLGIIAYELLRGTTPFGGGSAAAVLRRHISEEPEKPEGIGPPMWDFISALLRKDPKARPAGVAEARLLLDRMPGDRRMASEGLFRPPSGGQSSNASQATLAGSRQWQPPLLPPNPPQAAAQPATHRPSQSFPPPQSATWTGEAGLTRAGSQRTVAGGRYEASLPPVAPGPVSGGTDPQQPGRFSSPAAKKGLIGGGVLAVVAAVALVFALIGPEGVEIPDVEGLTASAARIALSRAGLGDKIVERADLDVPRGEVIESEPPAGAESSEGDVVVVLVSSGPPVVSVPDVVGLEAAVARDRIGQQGLEVEEGPAAPSEEPLGTVIKVDPAPGTDASSGSTVKIQLSAGLGPVPKVPNCEGFSPDECSSRLTALGYRVVQVTEASPVAKGKVARTIPAFNTDLPAASEVTIYLSTGLAGAEAANAPGPASAPAVTPAVPVVPGAPPPAPAAPAPPVVTAAEPAAPGIAACDATKSTQAGRSVQYCSVLAGNVPVFATHTNGLLGEKVGVLEQAKAPHWFVGQIESSKFSALVLESTAWAYTQADNGKWGWVPGVFFQAKGTQTSPLAKCNTSGNSCSE
ncbi:MAG: protein kinase domain-containing protein [Actinomycetota bacterium]